MKIKRYMLVFGIFLLLLGSCELFEENGDNSSSNIKPSDVPTKKFWAQNLVTEKFYQLDAEMLAESENCKVWVEKGSGVDTATAITLSWVYENEILPKMLKTFAFQGPITENDKVVANNTVELADYMGDGDGKLCILLLDIKDDYEPGVNDSYCAGYFSRFDLFENDPKYPSLRSNECDMIYIDTYPGKPGSRDSNATFAHEMQHMMSFVTTFLSSRYPNPLDIWIDEGLSSAAEWLYLGSHPLHRVEWYNKDQSGLIQKGNNFFVWGNREDENKYAVLDDYSTVYLFFQWLRLHALKDNIYYYIILSSKYDYRAVTDAANFLIPGRGYNNWEALLKTWLAANYINAPSGPYGYMNETILKDIRGKTVPAGVKSLSLAPGEGVYSITDSFALPDNTEYINYAGLNKVGAEISDTKTFPGGALLTFNANSNIEGSKAVGVTTGVASVVSANKNIASGGGSLQGRLTAPFAIGAGDMLRRNGRGELPEMETSGIGLRKFNKGMSIE
jgi:hypothetical protein